MSDSPRLLRERRVLMTCRGGHVSSSSAWFGGFRWGERAGCRVCPWQDLADVAVSQSLVAEGGSLDSWGWLVDTFAFASSMSVCDLNWWRLSPPFVVFAAPSAFRISPVLPLDFLLVVILGLD